MSNPLSNRRTDIQGLRAIAVLSVVIFHATSGAWLKGGFVGVDIFFVISGFLITEILTKAIDRGEFSLTEFYRRRIRRLFPTLISVLLFTLMLGSLILPPDNYKELGETVVATMLFLSNLDFLKHTAYFDGAAEYKPLLHTWSLAVEEQFYLVFPLFLFLVHRYVRYYRELLLFLIFVISLAASIFFVKDHPTSAFYLAPTRAFELIMGAMISVWSPVVSKRLGDLLSVAGIALIVASVCLIDRTAQFPGSLALAPCAGAALLILAGKVHPSLGGRLISPLKPFGDISYSLYLWHWPILALARNYLLGDLSLIVGLSLAACSVVLAFASWRWIETPFIAGYPRLNVITAGVVVMCLSVGTGAAIYVSRGLPERFDTRSRALFAAAEDYNRRRPACHSGEGEPIPYASNCVFGAPVQPTVAVWGDSHGAELSVALGAILASQGRSLIEITASACPPAIGFAPARRPHCARHNTETLAGLLSDPRVVDVVLAASFEYPQAEQPAVNTGLSASVQALQRGGKRVTLLEPIPLFPYSPPVALGLLAARGDDITAWGITRSAYQTRNKIPIALLHRLAAS